MLTSADRVLVTGANGFLGSALVEKLRSLQIEVITPSRADGFDLMDNDLDLDGVQQVFHLAARTFVPSSWDDPAGYYATNAQGVVRVLEQCRKVGAAVTYVSGFVYGNPVKQPIAESDPVRPNNPYAFSKFAGEQACRFYADYLGLRVNIVRPFNIYGPSQPDHFLLPIIIDQVVRPDAREVVVRDLAPRRDYIHIDDVVSGILAASSSLTSSTFNIGSGISLSVAEVIEAACRAAGVSKPARSTSEVRANEISDATADISALQRIGWRPVISFDKGIETMVVAARKRLAAA